MVEKIEMFIAALSIGGGYWKIVIEKWFVYIAACLTLSWFLMD